MFWRWRKEWLDRAGLCFPWGVDGLLKRVDICGYRAGKWAGRCPNFRVVLSEVVKCARFRLAAACFCFGVDGVKSAHYPSTHFGCINAH